MATQTERAKKNKSKKMKNYFGSNPRKSKKKKLNRICPVCGAPICMVPETEMNFRYFKNQQPGQEPRLFWRCTNYPKCDTYIEANPLTKEPNGTLAGPSLRHKRICIHKWEILLQDEKVYSKEGFRDMCKCLLSYPSQGLVHTKNMNEMECDIILDHMEKLYQNNENIHNIVESYPNSLVWKQVHGFNTAPNHGIVYPTDAQSTGHHDT